MTPSAHKKHIPCESNSFNTSATSIPFSWEKQPGVSKAEETNVPKSPNQALTLPPPFRSKPGYSAGDPFAAALVKCSKENSRLGMSLTSPAPLPAAKSGNSRDRFWFGFRFLEPYSSCKINRDVVDSTIPCPRSRRYYSAAYFLLNQK